VISVSSLVRHLGSSSRSKIDRRIARVLSAIGAAVSHFSPNSPKLFASRSRRFSRCFSIAGDRPSLIARLASMHSSRARASDSPDGPYLPNVTVSRHPFIR
jgi:hypothetical protein